MLSILHQSLIKLGARSVGSEDVQSLAGAWINYFNYLKPPVMKDHQVRQK